MVLMVKMPLRLGHFFRRFRESVLTLFSYSFETIWISFHYKTCDLMEFTNTLQKSYLNFPEFIANLEQMQPL